MSSSNDTAGSAFSIQAADDFKASLIIIAIAAALVFMDCIWTLRREFKYVWSKKIRTGSIVYLLARYGGVVQNLTSLIVNFDHGIPQSACTSLSFSTVLLSIIVILGIQGLTFATTLTVARANRWLVILLWLLFLAVQAFNLVFLKFTSCDLAVVESLAGELDAISLANSITDLCFETLVILIILYYTWGLYRQRAQHDATQVSLIALMVRAGIFRFGLILLWSLYGAISPTFLRPSLVGIDTPLQDAVSLILMCHFFLDLCEVQGKISDAQKSGQFTTKVVQEEEDDDFEGRIGLRINDGTLDRAYGPDAILTWQSDSGSVQERGAHVSQQPPRRRKTFDLESQSSQFSDDEDEKSPPVSSPPRAYMPAKPRMVHASGTIV